MPMKEAEMRKRVLVCGLRALRELGGMESLGASLVPGNYLEDIRVEEVAAARSEAQRGSWTPSSGKRGCPFRTGADSSPGSTARILHRPSPRARGGCVLGSGESSRPLLAPGPFMGGAGQGRGQS